MLGLLHIDIVWFRSMVQKTWFPWVRLLSTDREQMNLFSPRARVLLEKNVEVDLEKSSY